MSFSRMFRTLSVLLIMSLSLSAFADQEVGNLVVYEDVSGSLTIADIVGLPDQAFVPRPNGLSAGYTRSVHWLRFTVQAPRGEAGSWWLEVMPPYIDDIRLYEPDQESPGSFKERRTGDLLPFSVREAPYRGFLFRVDLDDAQARHLYVRIQNSRSSLALLHLWKPERFSAVVLQEYVLLGGVLGLMVIIIITNLIYGWYQRDPVIYFYIAYVISVLVSSLLTQGLVAQFLLPDQPVLIGFLQKATTLIMIALAGMLYQRMLRVDHSLPWLLWLYRFSIALPLLLLLALPLGFSTEALRLVMSVSVLMVVVGLLRSIYLTQQKVPGGIMVFAALVSSLLSLMAGLAQVLGWIEGHFLILHAVMIGLVFTVIALYMAIAARFRAEREQHQAAMEQSRLIEIKAERERVAREEQAHFMSMLAHELRTPIAGIAAATDAIEILPGGNEPDVQTRIERIRRSVRRIAGVADRYLQMDQADNARLDPKFSPHTLAAVVQLALDQCNDTEQRLRLLHVDEACLVCDAGLVATAVLNLIDNALKYSPSDSPVELSASSNGNVVEIKVDDGGTGVPESMRSAIFERYVRAPEHGTVPGIGVGLALVRKIAEVHHGHVFVEDRIGGGARFTLVLAAYPGYEMSGFVS